MRYGWIALAAAATLVVAVGIARRQGVVGQSLPDLVVAHVNGEERPALELRAPVPSADVAQEPGDRGASTGSVALGAGLDEVLGALVALPPGSDGQAPSLTVLDGGVVVGRAGAASVQRALHRLTSLAPVGTLPE